jgi:hypothetical protein
MKERHNCDMLRLKKLLGIEIDVEKYNSFSSIKRMIIKNKNESDVQQMESFLKNKNKYEINPNIIIFLKKCGFDLRKITRNNILGGNSFYYDIVCDNQPIFNIEFPAQVFYTNKILEALSKNEYFRKNYMEGDFIDLDLVKIEEEVENFSARYSQKKFLDFSIHSKFNNRCLVAIEINEYEHNYKQSEDEKRGEDLRARRNNQGFTIIGPFSIRLNKKGEIEEEEFDKFITDLLMWIKLIDDCQNRENFIVNFLVDHDVGNKYWCKLLYSSYCEKNKCAIIANQILERFGGNKMANIDSKKILREFVQYRRDYIYRLQEEEEEEEKESESANELFNKKKCESKKEEKNKYELNFEQKNDEILLNYNGISNFLQFLYYHEEYFRKLFRHNAISNYFINCQICMMDALEKLFNIQQKMLNSQKTSYYYGSYE